MDPKSANVIDSQLPEVIEKTKYARVIKSKHRRETWEELVDRCMNMHRKKYGPKVHKLVDEIREFMVNKRILGSQRALQFGGDAIIKHNTRIYNCTATYLNRVRAFGEIMYALLCGSGVGFSVQKHHIAELPPLAPRARQQLTYVVGDNIESWANSIIVLVSSYCVRVDDLCQSCKTGKSCNDGLPCPQKLEDKFSKYAGHPVSFDLSNIRPKGAKLSTGALAPGPLPLKQALNKINNLLHNLVVKNKETRLKPIDAYDIAMFASEAVMAGGVRRSASICIFSADDELMKNAKTGNWFAKNAQRSRSNNSALLIRNEVKKDDFMGYIRYIRQFGEPGFIWADDREVLFNPCGEACLYAKDDKDRTGFQMCNLCEINMKGITEEVFYESCRLVSALGTLQAGYTVFPYFTPITQAIVEKEALLGVSMTGMMDNPSISFNPKILRAGVEIIRKTNREIAALIGINPAARLTCIKPAGTSSCILNTSSGIHPRHARRYFRRVRMTNNDPVLKFYKSINPEAVEQDVYSQNDEVITFLCTAPNIGVVGNIGAINMLKKIKLVQENWVLPGSDEKLSVKSFLKHNVSNTVTVEDHEWKDVMSYIYDHRDCFVGVTLLPSTGDKKYRQAPFQAVPYANKITQIYGDGGLFASGFIRAHIHKIFGNDVHGACEYLESYIRGDVEEVKITPTNISKAEIAEIQAKLDKYLWCLRAKKFATKYFGGNIEKMICCIKDVDAAHKWTDLQTSITQVDWSRFYEDDDVSNHHQVAVCGGGECVLTHV